MQPFCSVDNHTYVCASRIVHVRAARSGPHTIYLFQGRGGGVGKVYTCLENAIFCGGFLDFLASTVQWYIRNAHTETPVYPSTDVGLPGGALSALQGALLTAVRPDTSGVHV